MSRRKVWIKIIICLLLVASLYLDSIGVDFLFRDFLLYISSGFLVVAIIAYAIANKSLKKKIPHLWLNFSFYSILISVIAVWLIKIFDVSFGVLLIGGMLSLILLHVGMLTLLLSGIVFLIEKFKK